MAAEVTLNQIVKGAPQSDVKVQPAAPLPHLADASSQLLASSRSGHSAGDDPKATDSVHSTLPSSPPQIYLNLLILEANLRLQYLHLLSRRRINTFFLLLLACWNCFFVWALFLRPREDGQGLGGSVYWVVEACERLAFMGGVVAVLLIKATGQWERGIRWPRRWLGTTNRGLRGFNLRVVTTKRKWYREMPGHLAFLLPFGLWTEAAGSDWHPVEHDNGTVVEEDLAPGGDQIMLLLLPKNFSSEFRENWETYRMAYWERENERRRTLKLRVKQQRRARAKATGGWKWWTGLWRLAGGRRAQRRAQDLEKHPHHRHQHLLSEKETLVVKATRRRSMLRDASHSRQSSRSSTPHLTTAEVDGSLGDIKPLSERVRRGSSVSSTSSIRRSAKGRERRLDGALSPLTVTDDDVVREKRTRRRDRMSESQPSSPVVQSGDRAPVPA